MIHALVSLRDGIEPGTRSRHLFKAPTLILAILVTTAVLLATACGSATTSTPSSSTKGATTSSLAVLHLAGGTDWGYPTPFSGSRGPSTAHTSLIFDELIWKNSKGDYIPWLATKWINSSDGTTWTFTLRSGVNFTDGQPLTAADVVFSYNYLTTGAGKVSPQGFSGLPHYTVSAPNATTVVFQGTQPYAVFLNNIALRMPVMPMHIWQSVTDPLKFQSPTSVIGSGPYTLQSYDKASGTYVYNANPNFFLGIAYVRQLQFVPTTNQLTSLRVGTIDMAEVGAGGISDATIAQASIDQFKTAAYGTTTAAGTVGRTIHFNLTKGFPYNNVQFRQAIAYAINRPDLANRILGAVANVASLGMIEPSDSSWVPKDLPTYQFNVAKANSLLDQIGLKLVNGVRTLPDGSPFTPQMLTSSDRWNPQTPVLIQGYLKAVGINLDVKTVDQTTADAATTAGNYTIALIGYGHANDPSGIATDMSSKATAKSFAGVYGWNNPSFETAAAQQAVTVDTAARTQQAYTMQRAIATDLPTISLYVSARMAIYNKTVFSSWYYTPNGGPLYPGLINKIIYAEGPAATK